MQLSNDFFIGLLMILFGAYCSYEGFRPGSVSSMAQSMLRAGGPIMLLLGILCAMSGIR